MNKALIFLAFLCMKNETIIFDKNINSKNWYITNDVVMGGFSNANISKTKTGNLIFSGEVSLENNGGFAMTRLPLDINFSDNNSKLVLKLKGDGKKYQFRIKSKINQNYWYVQSFQTKKTEEEIALNLIDFYPSFRGYKLNLDNFSGNNIREIAILIGNKKNENFTLEVEKIYLK